MLEVSVKDNYYARLYNCSNMYTYEENHTLNLDLTFSQSTLKCRSRAGGTGACLKRMSRNFSICFTLTAVTPKLHHQVPCFALKLRWHQQTKPYHRNRKAPKFWDTRKLCCNHPQTGNQRTNGPVNAHLISWPTKAQNIQNLENI